MPAPTVEPVISAVAPITRPSCACTRTLRVFREIPIFPRAILFLSIHFSRPNGSFVVRHGRRKVASIAPCANFCRSVSGPEPTPLARRWFEKDGVGLESRDDDRWIGSRWGPTWVPPKCGRFETIRCGGNRCLHSWKEGNKCICRCWKRRIHRIGTPEQVGILRWRRDHRWTAGWTKVGTMRSFNPCGLSVCNQ